MNVQRTLITTFVTKDVLYLVNRHSQSSKHNLSHKN